MEVHVNNKNHLNEFIRLNEEWINKYFSLEEADKSLARNPVSVIDNNGFIFTLVENGVITGVCALFNEGGGVYELARMAVSPAHQGKGYGSVLMKSCLNKLNEINATRVYLLSNTKLEAAISMYKKFGFMVIKEGQHPVYSRANIVMERSI